MADRRMLSRTILDSDKFLDMSLAAQVLYIHLIMNADDDGFLNNSQKIIRMIGTAKGDFEILVLSEFVIDFGNGICVIKHWKLHNYIRSDRYKPTVYQEELSKLVVGENKIYEIADYCTEALAEVSESFGSNTEALIISNKGSDYSTGILVESSKGSEYSTEILSDSNKSSEDDIEVLVEIQKTSEINTDVLEYNSKSTIYKHHNDEDNNNTEDVEDKDCDNSKLYVEVEHDFSEGNNYGIPSGANMETQDRLGKISIDKNSTGDKCEYVSNASRINVDKNINKIIDQWNSLGICKIANIKNNRRKMLMTRINEYGAEKVLEAIENIKNSEFLRGQNRRGWIITFDWFIRPNNFSKVMEGNYNNKKNSTNVIGFNNFKARDYDFDSLERKLLGWT